MRTYDATGGENCVSNRRRTRSWEGVFRGASEEEGQGMVHKICLVHVRQPISVTNTHSEATHDSSTLLFNFFYLSPPPPPIRQSSTVSVEWCHRAMTIYIARYNDDAVVRW